MSASKYKIHVTYDGTYFSGWQKQPHKKTVQELIETTLFRVTQERAAVIGSGRTDAGVHAIDQVAHFSLTTDKLSPQQLIFALNSLLPKDIRISQLYSVENNFHARYSATGKEYHYSICNQDIVSPFMTHYCYHYRHFLDVTLMQEASRLFIGTHDFKNFANTGRKYNSTIRHISSFEITRKEGHCIKCRCIGNGFLYKMMRNLVGALISVGSKKLSSQDLLFFLQSDKKKSLFTTAPAKGLFLHKVFY